jgi:3-deoxy-D-manno-octulosonic-acid transferase
MRDHQLIWARCQTPDDLRVVKTLETQLQRDGDPIVVMPTLPNAVGASVPTPQTGKQVSAFLGLYHPQVALWCGDALTPATIEATADAGVPQIAVNVTARLAADLRSTWRPNRRRNLLQKFHAVFATDSAAVAALEQAGLPGDRIAAVAPLEDAAPILTYDEDDRAGLAACLATRPVWLAAGAATDDVATLASAQRHAARRAHRLLLVVFPLSPELAPSMVEDFAAAGFIVARRSETLDPSDAVQVYVADLEDELGLWYRAAPITYFCGTLTGASMHDPYAAAALGSVAIHGHAGGQWAGRFDALFHAGASRRIDRADALGETVATLLSAERAALHAHAGWDVTTRGAETSEKLLDMLHGILDRAA